MKRGGAREGAGRKKKEPKDYSEALKKEWLKAEKELTKEYGETPSKKLLRMVYDEDVQEAVRASIGKQRIELLGVKESKQTVDHNFTGPAIGLPPIQEKPEEFRDQEQEKPESPKKEELH